MRKSFRRSPKLLACGGLLLVSIALPATQAPLEPSEQRAPVRFEAEALGQDGRITLTPTLTPDGSTMFFAQSECSPIWECPQRLKRSVRKDGVWSTPETVRVTARGRVDYPRVSPDGRFLLFSWAVERARHAGQDVYEDFDLYRLELDNADAVPVPLDEPDINRIRGGAVRQLRFVHNETAPALTRRGDLYFWTERLEGRGERDIYLAPADGRGGFLAPRPLPAPINSAGRDDGFWLNADGDLMLLTYSDRGGSGGADLFVSRLVEGEWSQPKNLGPRVNSEADDFAPMITPDGDELLFSSTRPVDGRADATIQVWTQRVDSIPALRDAD